MNMLLPIRKRWLAAIVALGIVATLVGWLALAVRRVQIAAERSSDL
jgi:hypothetical protein